MVMELKTLITWSSWFIGKKLIEELSLKKESYICFKWDLLDKSDIEGYFSNHQIHRVIHLVWAFDGDFDNQMKLNFNTTQNLLEIGSKFWLKKIIYTSTWAVYWNPKWSESLESDVCLPNTFYWLSKKITEDLITYYKENHAIQAVILRYPNVYWEGNTKWVIYNFLQQIQNNWNIVLYGDWTQWRNFLHVQDAVSAIILALEYEDSWIFNISNPIPYTLKDIICILEKKYKFNVEFKQANNNLQFLYLNIDKAKGKLWFEPKFKDIKI